MVVPTRSQNSSWHSLWDLRGTQAPQLRQSNKTLGGSDQELLQIPTEMFEWDEVKSDQELPTKMFEWNEEVSDEELTKEMTEWNEVVCDEELMNIPLEFFVPNDCESVEMDLGDSELIQGFLDCDSWDWDASTFDYEGNLFQICCAKNK